MYSVAPSLWFRRVFSTVSGVTQCQPIPMLTHQTQRTILTQHTHPLTAVTVHTRSRIHHRFGHIPTLVAIETLLASLPASTPTA